MGMIEDLFEKSILIFGCGNILFGDDGFGPAVVEHLKNNYTLPENALALDMGTSIRDILFNIALSEKKPQKIMIIDSIDRPGRKPGEVFEIPVKSIPQNKTSDFSLHQFPTVNLLEELQDQTGIEVKILVSQIGEIPESMAPSLSDAMKQAVIEACERIVIFIGDH